MDMIAADDHVDGSVQLDPCRLRTAQLLRVADMVNMAVLDDREYTAHAAYNACLLTMMNMAAADDMTADPFLCPAVILATAYGVPFHLGR